MFFEIILFIFIALLVCRHNGTLDLKQFKLWLIIFGISGLYLILTLNYNDIGQFGNHIFVSPDQRYFYGIGLQYSHYDIDSIIRKVSLMNPDSPRLSYVVNALWIKLANIFGCHNYFAFSVLRITFLTSLIPVIMYKSSIVMGIRDKNLIRKLILFYCFTPLLLYSTQLLRDIDITLLYTLLFYLCINRKISGRFIYIAICIAICYFFRIESGLFALMFLFVGFWNNIRKASGLQKLILGTSVTIAVIFIFPSIFNQTDETLTLYAERSASHASADSMGMKVWSFLGPIKGVFQSIFCLMQPFPFYLQMRFNYSWLLVNNIITPFYLITIIVCLFYGLKKYYRIIPRYVLYFTALSFLLIFLSSLGELNPRRALAVYPIIYLLYLKVIYEQNIPLRSIAIKVTGTLVILNLFFMLCLRRIF